MIMNKFKIHLETDTIIKHKNSITGIIYFDFNGILFPEKRLERLHHCSSK